ncbi:TetR/AcrR family transcriptional regulator [Streptomyces sp. SID13031]|uniref:TetR/AcrR family transcriptional regulator n=1 Tax=Streptomyces sp. SID13031 TaxID=2706046 RepID=UPI0013C827DE|nr:TetR/AcrR family transcriptional regulator [Streptomyces sp. SID13031]NEA35411.1 TetR/AcrR family transcriptional regulator [Streptomyces sp. SID13031]
MGRPRKFDEAQVLRAARDEFWQKGYAATSLDDLMKATGLGKGSLYGAFGDKHQLFLKVLSTYAHETADGVCESVGKGDRAIDILRSFFVPGPPDPVSEHDGPVATNRGCFLANSTTELAARDPEVTGCARATYQAVEDCFTNAVARAVAEGDLPEDTNPRELGRLLLTIQQGLQFLLKTEMTPEAMREVGRATADRLLPLPARVS